MKPLFSQDTRWQQQSVNLTGLSHSWMKPVGALALCTSTARGCTVLNSFPLKIDVSFFSLLLPWRGPCKDKSFNRWLETLARDARSLDKVSSAVHAQKYCMKQKDMYDNASSGVQLCYLNELCGIIIRLMPVQGWLGEEVKEASPSSEINRGINQSSITPTLPETAQTSSVILTEI